MVKAVKTSLPKVFAAEAVFLDSGFVPDEDIMGRQISADENLLSQFKDIFLIGDCGWDPSREKFFFNNREEAEKQALLLVEYLTEGVEPKYARGVLSDADIEIMAEKTIFSPED